MSATATTRPSAIYPTVRHALRDHAASRGDAVAMIFEDRTTTFGELDAIATRIASALRARGFADRATIAVIARNSDRYAEVIFGTEYGGQIVAPLNWRLAPPELEQIAVGADIDVLFFHTEFADVAQLLATRLPGLVLVCLDSDVDAAISFDALLAEGDPHAELPDVDPDAPSMLLYTSGTTGDPKGVVLSQYGLLFTLTQASMGDQPVSVKPDDVVLLSPPLFHIGGINILQGAAFFGVPQVIIADAKLTDIVAAIEQYRVTRAVVIPILMSPLLDMAESGRDIGSLRTVAYGMQPIPEPVLARMTRVLQAEFVQNYGMTEVSGAATLLGPADHDPALGRLASCGRAVPDTEVYVATTDGSAAAPMEAGEVMVRTPTRCLGFWQGADKPLLPVDEWYATGDVGYLDVDGYLYLCDRKKDMIVTGGENVYSVEVERVLVQHSEIEQVAVIAVPSEQWGEEVRAVVRLAPGSSLDAEDIIAFARGQLAGYKVPKQVDFVDEMPLTPVGKIAKSRLREPYWAERERQIN